MPDVTSYETGELCWADVVSPDVDAAAKFYSQLFGWQADKAPQPEAGGYTMFSRNGKYVAAASPPMDENIPPHWNVYLASSDVDDSAARIRSAGGTVMMEPFDVFDAGRMTFAVDPAGAVFGVWQAGNHIGSQLRREPGTINWAEVQTRDRGAAQPFYEQVIAPFMKQRNPTARRQAVETLEDLTKLGESMRAAFVRAALREYTEG